VSAAAKRAARTDIWRTGPGIHKISKEVWPGQRPFRWRKEAVCKTVGSAYASSNLAPATTSRNGPWPAVIAACGPFACCRALFHHVPSRGAVSQWLRTYSGRELGGASGSRHRRFCGPGRGCPVTGSPATSGADGLGGAATARVVFAVPSVRRGGAWPWHPAGCASAVPSRRPACRGSGARLALPRVALDGLLAEVARLAPGAPAQMGHQPVAVPG
jgi:hypothetical protein